MMMIPRLVALAALAAQPLSDMQAGDRTGVMFAPILRTERAGAGVVRIVYDLRGVIGTAFAVTLEASDDGGQTFTVRPQALTGDVGPRVAPGAEKAIVWDSTKDVDDLQVDRYVFRVIVSPGGQSAVPSPAAATRPPASGASGSPTGGKPGPANTAARKGGLSKGALVAIAGGGAAAAGVAVAAGKSASSASSSPPSSPAGSTTPTTLNLSGPYSVPMSVVVTNPDGSVPCAYGNTYAGTVTMSLQASSGAVTGTASLQGTSTIGATTCTTRSGTPSPTPGTVSSGILAGNVPVTGSAASLSFSRQNTGQGMTNEGIPTPVTTTISLTGALNSNTVTGMLSISTRDESQGTAGARIGLGSATVSVTLR